MKSPVSQVVAIQVISLTRYVEGERSRAQDPTYVKKEKESRAQVPTINLKVCDMFDYEIMKCIVAYLASSNTCGAMELMIQCRNYCQDRGVKT